MKEALTSPYKPIFRETFNSEQSVRSNGGVPTAVTFEKGIASFNGSATTKIAYPNLSTGTYSIRFRLKNLVIATKYLIDFSNGNVNGAGYIHINAGTGLILRNIGTAYVDGVANDVAATTTKEIVVTGMAINSTLSSFLIGNRAGGNYGIGADIDLVEIYKGTLTASEVKNLYDNDWNKEFISSNLLLDYDSTNGYITDRTGKNTLTATDVSIKKTGSFYSADFNGTTSLINTGTDIIGTKAITVCGWIYPTRRGGRVITNGKFELALSASSDKFFVWSDASTIKYSGVITFNKWYFLSLIRKSDGKITFYLGDKNTAPSLSSTADQYSGTSEVGSTNVFIGGSPYINAQIPNFKVYEGILDLETITQIWSSTRGKIE